MRATLVFFAIFAALLALFVRFCSGARPEVVSQALRAPEGAGQPWKVEATVRNEGWGEGEVQVDVRLIDQASGRAFGEGRRLDVRPKETVRLVVPLHVPHGDYRLQVKADYPPR